MPFAPPDFNLTCDIYTGPFLSRVLRLSGVPCNLAFGRRVQVNYLTGVDGLGSGANSNLLLPALTDVRDASTAGGYDVIEVVPGSGRMYAVTMVDDVGKGFSNEYRIAVLVKASEGISHAEFLGYFWPTPIP